MDNGSVRNGDACTVIAGTHKGRSGTVEAVRGVDLAVEAGEVFGFLGDPTSPITGTTYPVGATAVQCHAGTTFWSIDSNNIASGTYKLQGMLIGSGGATVTAALVNLTDASETPIVTIASASTTGALVQSSAITFAAGGVAKTYAIKVKVDTGSGEVWGVSVVKTA